MDGLRVRVPLGANVPRRRPLADASSFISHPRAPAPGVSACAATHKRKTESAFGQACDPSPAWPRSEEHTSELQSLMRISYAVFCLKKNKPNYTTTYTPNITHPHN